MAEYVYGSDAPYGKYLQENAYVRDITGQIKKSGEATRNQISAQTREVVASNERLSQEFGAGFDAVNGTLEFGFDRVNSALGYVESSIESLHSDFNYNMGLVLDQLQIQNQLTFGILEKLDAIHKTLVTPRLTQARECYNIGCERLSKGLLDKALEAFLKAEERNDTDFFTVFQIGKLYLYGVDEDDNVIDLVKAEQHLRNAARYGKAEISGLPEFRRWTGEALLHASIACYVQANDHRINENTVKAKEFISKAFKLAQQACEIYPSLSESQYHLAKYAALMGNEEICVQSLEKAVIADLNYCLKIEFDRDFNDMLPQVFGLFEQLRVKMRGKARRRLQSTQKSIAGMVYTTDQAKKGKEEIDNLLSNAEKKISNDTLFDIHESLQILNRIGLIFSSLAETLVTPEGLKNAYEVAKDSILNAENILNEANGLISKSRQTLIVSEIVDERKTVDELTTIYDKAIVKLKLAKDNVASGDYKAILEAKTNSEEATNLGNNVIKTLQFRLKNYEDKRSRRIRKAWKELPGALLGFLVIGFFYGIVAAVIIDILIIIIMVLFALKITYLFTIEVGIFVLLVVSAIALIFPIMDFKDAYKK